LEPGARVLPALPQEFRVAIPFLETLQPWVVVAVPIMQARNKTAIAADQALAVDLEALEVLEHQGRAIQAAARTQTPITPEVVVAAQVLPE
jgi:hypothetical protein